MLSEAYDLSGKRECWVERPPEKFMIDAEADLVGIIRLFCIAIVFDTSHSVPFQLSMHKAKSSPPIKVFP